VAGLTNVTLHGFAHGNPVLKFSCK